MTTEKFDFVSTGIIAAFDSKTGKVLHVHEKFVEVASGQSDCEDGFNDDELAEIREQVANDHSTRSVDVIVSGPELGQALGRPVSYRVDLDSRKLYTEELKQ